MTSPATPIRFVYFDLGNVLVSFDRQIACRNVAGLFAHSCSDQIAEASVLADRILHESGLQNDLESGRVSEADFAEKVRSAMVLESIAERVLDDAILNAISDMFTPIESMRDVLRRVRKTGVGIGILSNTCNAHWSWVNSQAYAVLEGPFDVQVVSHQVRSMKPDRLIYEFAATQAAEFCGAGPKEILFLDDREENVIAAREFGWHSEVCVGGPEAEAFLVSYGVLSRDEWPEVEQQADERNNIDLATANKDRNQLVDAQENGK